MRRLLEKILKISEAKFSYGDFITLKPGAKVTLSDTGEPIPQNIIDDGKLWAVDGYEEETGMLNINRVLKPYPGAYCSFVHEDDVVEEVNETRAPLTIRSVDRKGEEWFWEDEETGQKSEVFGSFAEAQESANKHWEKIRGKKFKKYPFRYRYESVDESSIDFPRESLDLAIWDKKDDSYILRGEVKKQIIDLISKYSDKNLNDISEEIHIVGSIATNQYIDEADIDVHIIPKSIDEWSEEETNKVRKWFNEHRDELDGYVDKHPIEVYIQLDPNQDLMSDGCYNILDDKWLTGPKVVPMNYDPYDDFSHIADDIRSTVEDADKLFGELKRDLIDYDVIKDAMERMSGEDKERLLQKLQSKLNELEDDIEALYKKRGEWVDTRHKASKPETPEQALKDVELAKKWRDTNAIFKFVNRYHYLKAINDLRNLLEDEEITPDEIDKIKSIMGV